MSENKPPFLMFATVSATWLVVALLFGWLAESPEGCVGTFSCLTANEWGDYLAGVFAPLAFLWLIAAVVLQSRELVAQREELSLTRDEMREQRGVLAAQADEARRQAEFIGLQTNIMQRQEDERKEAMDVQAFDEKVVELQNLIKQRVIGDLLVLGDGETLSVHQFDAKSTTVETAIPSLADFFVRLPRVQKKPIKCFTQMTYRTMQLVHEHAADLIALSDRIGFRREVVVHRLNIKTLEEETSKILALTEKVKEEHERRQFELAAAEASDK